MEAYFLSDKGLIRSRNEDSGGIFINNKQWLAVVADGMGGHLAGDVASQKTVQYIKEAWEEISVPLTAESAVDWLNTTINKINRVLYEFAAEHDECKGMGTTIVAAIGFPQELIVSHVGDSRAYLFHPNIEEALITEDHTLVQELVNHGQLSKEDAFHHPKKNIVMRALGTEEEIDIDTLKVPFPAGAMLMICSDGLSDKLKFEEIERIIQLEQTLPQKGQSFISEAIRLGGEDNITVALILNDSGDVL